jgi:hypothetical protein
MKHQSDDRFTWVRKDRYLNLLCYLLAHYQGLYEKIAPEGFENSPYRTIYDTTTRIAYRNYREQRAFTYKLNRMKYRGPDRKMVVPQIGDGNRSHSYGEIPPYYVPDLLSYEEFAKSKASVNPDVKLSAFYLYISCFEDIFNHRPIVYATDFRCYTCNSWDYKKLLKEATGRVLPEYLDVFDHKKFSARQQDYKTDLTPIYEYIYQLFKAKNIDVMYTTIDEKIFKSIIGSLEKTYADAEADRILFTDYGDKDINEAEAERKERHAAKRNIASPRSFKAPVVDAYHNVYGKLMENYRYPWK